MNFAFLRRNRLMIACVACGAALGAALAWWLSRPPTPWMVFEELTARHVEGSGAIILTAEYTIERQCRQQSGRPPIHWRLELFNPDGTILLFHASNTVVPEHALAGDHVIQSEIAIPPTLAASNFSDVEMGVILTCPGETPETVISPRATVEQVQHGFSR